MPCALERLLGAGPGDAPLGAGRFRNVDELGKSVGVLAIERWNGADGTNETNAARGVAGGHNHVAGGARLSGCSACAGAAIRARAALRGHERGGCAEKEDEEYLTPPLVSS